MVSKTDSGSIAFGSNGIEIIAIAFCSGKAFVTHFVHRRLNNVLHSGSFVCSDTGIPPFHASVPSGLIWNGLAAM